MPHTAATVPPSQFTFSANNLDDASSTPPAGPNIGTNFTAGASSTDGTSVSVLSALAADACMLVVGIGGVSFSTHNAQCLLDVLIDPAGGTSWSSLIDDLVCGMTPIPTAAGIGIGLWYHFPLFIKAGSSLGVRAKTRHTADETSGRVVMEVYGMPSQPDATFWVGTKVETLGAGANSQGTDIVPGDSGTWGSWTTIGTSTANYGAVQYGVNGTDGTAAALGYYFQVGHGSQKLAGSPTIYASMTTSEVGYRMNYRPIWCSVANGTVWQMRGVASGASAETWNGCVYGVM